MSAEDKAEGRHCLQTTVELCCLLSLELLVLNVELLFLFYRVLRKQFFESPYTPVGLGVEPNL